MWQLLFLSLCCMLNAENKFYTALGKKDTGYYSQCGQDEYLHKTFFRDKKNGIFIDIGAHDGIALSNTKFFEELGWTGICIEPIPEVFEELKKNRNSLCIQGCISNRRGMAQFLRVNGYSEMLSGLLDQYHPLHLQRIFQETSIPKNEGSVQIIAVQCYLLNDLLKENGISHVDYLSIDTEGGEFGILQSIDFTQFDIDIIEVENNFNDPKFPQFMTQKGYLRVAVLGWNDIYRKIKSS